MAPSPQLLLVPAAVASPLGISLALAWSPLVGGVVLLAGVTAGLWGLHRLGRDGPR